MPLITSAPKGTKDVTPAESYKWRYIESVMRDTCDTFGYREIRTPAFEHTELFLRGVGQTTDIVQKEMYTFTDKGNRSVTLKPEGTAGVVRAFIEDRIYADAQPTKMFYLYCPVFRYERPQAGRLREHHQFGVEVFGAPDASADAEIIALAFDVFQKLGVRELTLNINSIGCEKCRPEYTKRLKEYFAPHINDMCEDCKRRIDQNPLRLLDCKKCATVAKDAPSMLDSLCDDCAQHFVHLKRYLTALGLDYTINPRIVRGLDYYTKTVFEIISTHAGSQGTVCGGGRYDRLVEEIGGPPMAGVGFGMGMERLLLVMGNQGVEIPRPPLCDVFFCTYGEAAKTQAVALCGGLRQKGIKAEVDHARRSMKAQFKYADKIGATYTVVIGDDELAKGVVKLKNMQSGVEREIETARLADAITLK
jgi:histidyl-tRNA synthetase